MALKFLILHDAFAGSCSQPVPLNVGASHPCANALVLLSVAALSFGVMWRFFRKT
jgi:hypothetical protein